MLSDVNETAEVLTVFKRDLVWPKLLRWNGRIYNINKVNMRHQTMDGQTLVHYFSVSDKDNFFKLAFNTKNLQWKLEQVYSEG